MQVVRKRMGDAQVVDALCNTLKLYCSRVYRKLFCHTEYVDLYKEGTYCRQSFFAEDELQVAEQIKFLKILPAIRDGYTVTIDFREIPIPSVGFIHNLLNGVVKYAKSEEEASLMVRVKSHRKSDKIVVRQCIKQMYNNGVENVLP